MGCRAGRPEIAKKMKHLRPTIPMVILSGFSLLPGDAWLANEWCQRRRSRPENVDGEVEVSRPLDHSDEMTSR